MGAFFSRSSSPTDPEVLAKYVADHPTVSPDEETEAYSSGEEDNTPKNVLRERRRAVQAARAHADHAVGIARREKGLQDANIEVKTGGGRMSLYATGQWALTGVDRLKELLPGSTIRVTNGAERTPLDTASTQRGVPGG